mgnify:CR=1 FL=1
MYIYLLSFHDYLYWTMPEKSECLLVGVRQRQGDTRQMGPGCGDRSWGTGEPDTCHLQPVLTPEYKSYIIYSFKIFDMFLLYLD